mgnify:CR=1 FL=1
MRASTRSACCSGVTWVRGPASGAAMAWVVAAGVSSGAACAVSVAGAAGSVSAVSAVEVSAVVVLPEVGNIVIAKLRICF